MTQEGNETIVCPKCGVVDAPRIEDGAGPHVRKAVCTGCGKMIKWLRKTKEERMVASVNRVMLLGTVSDRGVEVSFVEDRGTAKASFLLILSETGHDGKTYQTYVPCEIWGKKAESAGEVEAGQLVLFEGRLRKRQKGDVWELIIGGFEIVPVGTPVQA